MTGVITGVMPAEVLAVNNSNGSEGEQAGRAVLRRRAS